MKFVKHLNGRSWKSVIEAKWWPNQQKAVELAGDYLDAKKDQQAMIRMPTGTGKTVVIATLAQLLENYQRVLVVAPWENLVGQLEREISTRLWMKLDEAKSLNARPTKVFTPASLKAALKHGRVIRNPTRATGQKAFVLAHQQDRQNDLWSRFIEYEKNVRERKKAGHAELAAFDEFIASHANAPSFYLLGDFRRHLRADEISDPRQVIQMRKPVLVRVEKPGFNWKKLVFGIQSELLTGDAVGFGGSFQDKKTYLQLFQIFEQSDVVSEAYMEIRLGYVFAKQLGNYLFFFDSEGRTVEESAIGLFAELGCTIIQNLRRTRDLLLRVSHQDKFHSSQTTPATERTRSCILIRLE